MPDEVQGSAFIMRTRFRHAEAGAAGDDWGYQSDGYGDPASVRDEQLGKIFRDMRHAMKVSRETIARRLATSSATIESFEAGAVSLLPHWKETGRIVRTYCELLRVDAEPILRRIRIHLQEAATQAKAARVATPIEFTTPRTGPRSVPTTRGARTQPAARPSPRRRRRRARVLFALSAPLALGAALVYLAQAMPQPVYRALSVLPDRAEIAVRAGLDYLVLLSAPQRDGLRWVEVSDPRARKADRLREAAR
jgi:transcriptional regulator with XRE-family HTH domain